ncbi:MAG: hypothetical protein K1X72_19655 [Pyrinomonadaceae bacterium]|nr:hypothetical protein [Pyrinomonadaceae bacterium]
MSENKTGIDSEKNYPPLSERKGSLFFFVFGGVLLPIIALVIELSNGMCAEFFFNPIPTLWHVLLVASVPFANAYIIWALFQDRIERPTLLVWTSLVSMAVCLFYGLVFLPLSPLGVIGIPFAGIGFLPLSPLFAWSVIWLMRREIFRRIGGSFAMSWKGLIIALIVVIGTISLSEIRIKRTREAIIKAGSADFQQQKEGLNFLRNYGDDFFLNTMNRFPYSRNLSITEAVESFFNTNEEYQRENYEQVYYQIKGETYSEKEAREYYYVPSQDQNLQIVASQIDGSIDNDASLGYLEWTFIFKNTDNWQREAEGEIQLPKDGVVSRLTLWINGEEREAAFAENGRVTRAYNSVTAKRRDPVLVTKSGKDLIRMRCFPVEPNGGEMKIRIGITFPLALENEKSGLIQLPFFKSNYFSIPDATKHIVWIESKNRLESANQNLKFERENKVTAIRGNLSNSEIKEINATIRAAKSENKLVWTKDETNLITQKIEVQNSIKPTRLVFMIDTSKRFASEKENVISLVKNLSSETEVGLVLSGGSGLNEGLVYPNSFIGTPLEIAEKINQANFDGGTDNMPALSGAQQLALEKEGSAIIALYAPQPFEFETTFENKQFFTRRFNHQKIFRFVNSNKYDFVENSLKNYEIFQTPPRYSDLKTDVESLLKQLKEQKISFRYVRQNVEKADVTGAKQTSKHLIRLWANDEVSRILDQENDEKKAIELAQKYQLVTPVTGAVVLETQAQYDQFGLKPVEKNSVPTIPEPETYLLIAVVLGVFLWLIATRKLF